MNSNCLGSRQQVILILMPATPLAEAAEFGGLYSVYPEREVLLR
jgi:hypothetical protein